MKRRDKENIANMSRASKEEGGTLVVKCGAVRTAVNRRLDRICNL